jgi:S-adenosylmethionine:tRNA ribosyltransferase-isomerase
MTTTSIDSPTTHFVLSDELTATEPPEHRGSARDQVRLLVGRPDRIQHTTFRRLADHLDPGDLVVVNTSQTLAAEFDARTSGGPVVIHVATQLEGGEWVVELRTSPVAAAPVLDASIGDAIELPTGGRLRLDAPYPYPDSSPAGNGNRLWRATGDDLTAVMARFGRPIAYGYLSQRWPLTDYQTIFGRDPGSAEMPSAGRPFSGRVLAQLAARGVRIAPITLHTGVSSQDAGEGPQDERFSVPETTARLVNATRRERNRVVAVGTTVTRALESAAGPDRLVRGRHGWTDLILGPSRPIRVVSGLITGWHNPEASHLMLVEAVAGVGLTQQAYDEAISEKYRWHEFGDSALLLPDR